MATVETISALELADALREGRGVASAFTLWQAAHCEARGHIEARLTLFRHAMIHAGYTLTARGGRYRRCPMCHNKLNR